MSRLAPFVAAYAVILCGCQTDGSGTTATPIGSPDGPPPVNYRTTSAEWVRANFKDPFTIRDAEIAPPKPGTGPSLNADGFKTPWIVCLRANAKNSMGAYTGRKMTALAYSGERIVNSFDEAHYSGFVCQGASYQPFPEIEEGRATAAAR